MRETPAEVAELQRLFDATLAVRLSESLRMLPARQR